MTATETQSLGVAHCSTTVTERECARRMTRLLRENVNLRKLLKVCVDPEPCDYDRSGLCQAHGLSPRPCYMAQIKVALKSPNEKGQPRAGHQ